LYIKGCSILDFIPLSQRNLPASFFISNYQYPISTGGSSSFSSFAHDLYHHHAHHAAAAAAAADPYSGSPLLGADVDPWQNYMAAAAGSAYTAAHHRAGDNSGLFNSIYSVIPNACTTIIFKCLQYSYTRVSW
jgi:hypothetical protein